MANTVQLLCSIISEARAGRIFGYRPDVSPLDLVKVGGHPDVVEAACDGGDCAVDEQRGLGVDVDAVEILRLVDRSQQPLGLFNVPVHHDAERQGKLGLLG